MDWDQAIERQHGALLRIVALLFEITGLAGESSVTRLPTSVYRFVLRILYPAESAVRRLIFVLARGLQAKLPARRPLPVGLASAGRTAARRPSFQLCDPRRSCAPEGRASGPRLEPRLHAFRDGQLVTIFGRSPLETLPQPVATTDATRLCGRLAAIKAALDNLPREAKRLARWRARRESLPPENIRRPLRPGRPPGFRRDGGHEVDEVLKDCQWLASLASRPDTS